MDPVLDLVRDIENQQAAGQVDALRQYEGEALAAECIRDEWKQQVKKAAKEGSTAVAIEIFTAIMDLSLVPKYFLTILFHE